MTLRKILLLLTSVFLLQACNNAGRQASDPDVYYTCSMDPQVVEQHPGKCPICKMDLTPVRKKKGGAQDELHLSEQQIQLGNIQTDTFKLGSMFDRLVLTATLNTDQRKTFSIAARVMGRVDRLYFKTVGDYVTKGAALYDLYSEDLNNAQSEYLLALAKRKQFANETMIDFDQLVAGAENKLLLWGMTSKQVSELANTGQRKPVTTIYSTESGFIAELDIREGDYVMEGSRMFTLADLSVLWAEAQLFSSQMAGTKAYQQATVKLPDWGNREIKGTVEFVNPEMMANSRTNLLRISIPNTDGRLKPGMPAYVMLEGPRVETFFVPVDAVIRDGRGATVWVQTAERTFKSVMVQTGIESGGRIEIKDGLNEGDLLVVSGAYLLHSEFVFKKGADPMAGHNH